MSETQPYYTHFVVSAWFGRTRGKEKFVSLDSYTTASPSKLLLVPFKLFSLLANCSLFYRLTRNQRRARLTWPFLRPRPSQGGYQLLDHQQALRCSSHGMEQS